MKQMIRFTALCAFTALACGATTLWNISFEGNRIGHDITAVGHGSFTYEGHTDNFADIGLSDLSTFSFTESVLSCDYGCPAAPTVLTFGLPDLFVFDLQTVAGTAQGMTIRMISNDPNNPGDVYGSGGPGNNGDFILTSIGGGGVAFGHSIWTDPTSEPTPEITTLAMMGLGLVAIGWFTKRRRMLALLHAQEHPGAL